MKIIDQVRNGEHNNHMLPFLWMHGESQETITEYLEKILSTGINEVCLESRPYEEFLRDEWWEDLSYIIKECERLGMSFWILDDKRFPSGYANGVISEKHPHLQKLFLSMKSLDFVGPKKNAKILLKWMSYIERPTIMSVGSEKSDTEKNGENNNGGSIIAVYAARKTSYNKIDEETIILLNDKVKNDVLTWDMPNGEWSIFVLSTTHDGGEEATAGYLNPLLKESTHILLDTVYKAHYEKFSDKFGTVIKGFFSDEPRFGNIKGPNASIGRVEMPLPWTEGLEDKLSQKLLISKSSLLAKLLLLFIGESKEAYKIRYEFMDLITMMYSENFSQLIGDWCNNHNVEYIGHVIEDNNAHARLGYGSGHFFRSMSGQDMAGIDIVLHQLIPRQNRGFFKSFTSNGWDGEFFTYGLAKLGASLGHLDPKKKGRTMCEVYGAYGWSEGLRLMKWITDHMLVSGVNYFVPHAFNMNSFPDLDCPPHFYASGNDIEFPSMNILITYINRISHLLSGGKHSSSVGLLYHGEAEWLGEYMEFQKPAKILTEHQIEFDVVSIDMILNHTNILCNSYSINNQIFNSLVIPYSQNLPDELIVKLDEMLEHGIEIIFIKELPEVIKKKQPIKDVYSSSYRIIELEELHLKLKKDVDRLVTKKKEPYLRYYHYNIEHGDIFMLFNEDLYNDMNISVSFPTQKLLRGYNPIDNKIIDLKKSGNYYEVLLSKGETLIVYTVEHKNINQKEKKEVSTRKKINLNNYDWNLEVLEGFGKPESSDWSFNGLPELDDLEEFQEFSGTLSYTTQFFGISDKAYLGIEDLSEVGSVYINDVYIDTKIAYPYTFELSSIMVNKWNRLEIRVTNNLGRYMKDYLSQYLFIDNLGIIGDISIIYEV